MALGKAGTIFRQERLIKLKTSLPDETFTALGFSGTETLSTLYSFDIDLISENHRINFNEILGSNASLIVEIDGQKTVTFNGIICRFSQGSGGGEEGSDTRYSHYTATLAPGLWLATQVKKMRKWLNSTSSDVIRSILSEHALSGNIAATSFLHDYVLQYNETDFNVIARLLEEEDMYFYFDQSETSFEHKLVSVKPPGNPSDIGTIRYLITGGGLDEGDIITSLTVTEEIKTNRVGLADQVPKKTVDIVSGMDSSEMFPSRLGVKEYPGDIEDPSRADLKAKIRLGRDQARKVVLSGSSNCMSFRCGKPFKLTNYYRAEMNGEKYLLTSVSHQCHQDLEGQFSYSNSFVCIPSNVLFRPPRTAIRPKVSGIQTAVVTEEPDREGWIKVKVPWDGMGESGPLEHPRARVCQPWAGEGFGAWFVPKLDHEVVLDFVDSDPHKPVVTGRVYNLNKRPPYGHEAHLKTTIRTAKEHEITFDDEDRTERVYRYSHKDEDVLVERNLTETVNGDEDRYVGGNLTVNIVKDTDVVMSGNYSKTVEKERALVVEGANYEKVQERNLTVSGDDSEKIDGDLSVMVRGDNQQKTAGNFAHEAGMEIHLKAGMAFVLEAGVQLSLKVGGNFIHIGPSGISIQGTMVMINSGGAPGSGSGSNPKNPHTSLSDGKKKKAKKTDKASHS